MEKLATIKEFLKNGGILKEGRDIFTSDSNDKKLWPVGQYKGCDEKLKTHLVKNKKFSSFPITEENKVIIKICPIWK